MTREDRYIILYEEEKQCYILLYIDIYIYHKWNKKRTLFPKASGNPYFFLNKKEKNKRIKEGRRRIGASTRRSSRPGAAETLRFFCSQSSHHKRGKNKKKQDHWTRRSDCETEHLVYVWSFIRFTSHSVCCLFVCLHGGPALGSRLCRRSCAVFYLLFFYNR